LRATAGRPEIRPLGGPRQPKAVEAATGGGKSPVGDDGGAPRAVDPEYRAGVRCGKQGGPPSKARGPSSTDSAEYREGTVKSPPGGE
jgi:hypothetical protein